jgi:hypothetical protein
MGAYLILMDKDVNEDGSTDDDVDKWLQLHGCRTHTRITLEGPKLGVEIPLICHALDFDKNEGLWTCLIHGKEEQPKRCRDYQCSRAKQDG